MARKKTKKRPSKSKAPKKQVKLPSLKLSRKQKVVLGSFLMLFGFALLIAFSSFLINWQIDQSELSQLSERNVQTRNWLSSFGAGISNFFIYKGFGVASFSLAILTFLTGFYLFLNLNSQRLKAYWFWGVLLMVWLSVFFGFFAEKNAMLGGTIGFETNDYLQDYLGLIGTILLMLFLAIVYLVFRLKITPERISVYFKKASSDIKEEFASDEEAPINTMANEKASVKQDIVPDSSDNTTTEEVVIEQQLEPIVDEPKITSTTIEASNEDDISMEVETTEEEEVSETKANKLVEDFG
jgi:S-DNA-T family DNA segregation ATPase FtsK/SpoIIIE